MKKSNSKRIREKMALGVAAIGSATASAIYELPILAESIHTYKNNLTRFLIVGSDKEEILGANKASVCFALGHKPGSLANLLVKIADLNINLTRIQSVPKYDRAWEYLFYLELEFDNTIIKNKLIELLTTNTSELTILGIYKNNGDTQI